MVQKRGEVLQILLALISGVKYEIEEKFCPECGKKR